MCAGELAIGCTPPLGGTHYTLWIQQFSSIPFLYSFTFVPEPGSIALIPCIGLLALLHARRRA